LSPLPHGDWRWPISGRDPKAGSVNLFTNVIARRRSRRSNLNAPASPRVRVWMMAVADFRA